MRQEVNVSAERLKLEKIGASGFGPLTKAQTLTPPCAPHFWAMCEARRKLFHITKLGDVRFYNRCQKGHARLVGQWSDSARYK